MQQPTFAYSPAPELTGRPGSRRPVIVVGAGPVGLCAAIDLAQHGVPVLLLDEDSRLSEGSRAICFSKRTLEPEAYLRLRLRRHALHAAVLEPRIQRVAIEESVTSYMAIARAKIHRGLEDIIVPGVLKDYDLPDLARHIGPKRLWIVEPRLPSGTRIRPNAAKAEYPGFPIRYRPESVPVENVYGEWLK